MRNPPLSKTLDTPFSAIAIGQLTQAERRVLRKYWVMLELESEDRPCDYFQLGLRSATQTIRPWRTNQHTSSPMDLMFLVHLSTTVVIWLAIGSRLWYIVWRRRVVHARMDSSSTPSIFRATGPMHMDDNANPRIPPCVHSLISTGI